MLIVNVRTWFKPLLQLHFHTIYSFTFVFLLTFPWLITLVSILLCLRLWLFFFRLFISSTFPSCFARPPVSILPFASPRFGPRDGASEQSICLSRTSLCCDSFPPLFAASFLFALFVWVRCYFVPVLEPSPRTQVPAAGFGRPSPRQPACVARTCGCRCL